MKITPIEIRQHTFQRVLRGYDIEEVVAFLTSLSNEWERVLNENKMLKMQLEIAEKELNKLREVELTMFRMLKTAEDTSSQMTEQAKTAAEQYINEARQKAEEVIGEARKRGNILITDSENQAKYVREEILGEFKNHERDLKAMEKYRDNLIVQLKTLANNTNDSIERFEKKFSQAAFKEKIEDLRTQVGDSIKADEATQKARAAQEAENAEPTEAAQEAETTTTMVEEAIQETAETTETVAATAETELEKPAEKSGSFFDQIK
jgi:cell division initiation protein